MNIKLLEIRDRGTCMPCFAFKPNEVKHAIGVDPKITASAALVESYLVGRSGYGGTCNAIIFGSLNDPDRCQNDPYAWPHDGARTLPQAHLYIEKHWNEIQSGDVIDVEFILGVSAVKKVSEALSDQLTEHGQRVANSMAERYPNVV